MKDLCEYCGNEIKIQIFKGTGYCSENHRKKLEGDETIVEGIKRKRKP
jgi:hypothetical protein